MGEMRASRFVVSRTGLGSGSGLGSGLGSGWSPLSAGVGPGLLSALLPLPVAPHLVLLPLPLASLALPLLGVLVFGPRVLRVWMRRRRNSVEQ